MKKNSAITNKNMVEVKKHIVSCEEFKTPNAPEKVENAESLAYRNSPQNTEKQQGHTKPCQSVQQKNTQTECVSEFEKLNLKR